MKKYFWFFSLLALLLNSCEKEEPLSFYSLTTSVSPLEGGNINISPDSLQYREGEVVILTPKPNNGWRFEKWEGSEQGSSSPLRVTMTSNKSITGVFVKRDYPLNVTIEGEGTVEEKIITNPAGREYPYETLVELTPKPKEGWVFGSWGGDLKGIDFPKIIEIKNVTNVIAKFVKEDEIFFLHPNGITCMCPKAKPGDKGLINGVLYEAVDNNSLRKKRDEKADMNKLCTSLVTDMKFLFANSDFNTEIGNWDLGNVTNMDHMFFRASQFNKPIGNWNVGKVTNMMGTFRQSKFNQNIENWDVSNVIVMEDMFSNSQFNQPIGNWDVGRVKAMYVMFAGSRFNQPIGNWDVSNVLNMTLMFSNSQFNQDISNWCVEKITSEPIEFSQGSPLLPEYKPVWGTCPD